jgi:hypothetical protein
MVSMKFAGNAWPRPGRVAIVYRGRRGRVDRHVGVLLAPATLNRAADLLDLLITDVIAPGNTDASRPDTHHHLPAAMGNQKEKRT